jgi:putative ABC transport system substrate-binding protein
MRRRELITLIGGAAAWPLAAQAQQAAIPVIGFLGFGSSDLFAARSRAFRQGLQEIGFVDGQNVTIEFRWGEGRYDRMPALAADLARRQVTVIVAAGGVPSAQAAKAATTTIPIVFVLGTDPVDIGLVASLNRPGGNVTGVYNLNAELGGKLLELLHELVPTAASIAWLMNPTNPNAEALTRGRLAAARALGLQLHVLHASTQSDLGAVFATAVQLRVGALAISGDQLFIGSNDQLVELAARHAVPTISPFREFAAAGGLMGYGGSFAEPHRLAGVYTGRILKGEKPADLPVQQSTKVELIINLKTAKALGITVPISLLGRADEVIE